MALVTFVLVVGTVAWARFRSAGDAFRSANETLLILERLSSDLVDAETGQRGYLLTLDERYLEPYGSAVTSLPEHLTELRARVGPRGDVDSVHRITLDKLNELGRTIELARAGRRDEALSVVRSGRGKQLMDELRARISVLEAGERNRSGELWDARTKAAQLYTGAAVGGLLALMGLVASVAAVRREALQQSEFDVELRGVLEAMPVGVALVEVGSGQVVFTNGAIASIVGEDTVGERREERRSWRAFRRNGEPLTSHEMPSSRVARGERIERQELVVERRDGARSAVVVSSGSVAGADGRSRLGVVVLDDVTALEKASDELRRTTERYRATFEQAAVGIAEVALDGRWLNVNAKLCEIVGYSREELLSMTFQDITVPGDLGSDLTLADDVMAGRRASYALEKRYLRRDGAIVWVRLTVALVREAGGAPAHFISVIEDIDQSKKTRIGLELLARSGEALSGSLEVGALARRLSTALVPDLADRVAIFLRDRAGGLQGLPSDHPARLGAEAIDGALEGAANDVGRGPGAGGDGTRLVVPLLVHGEVIGAAALEREGASERARYGEDDVRLAEEVARRAAVSLDNARMHAELEERVRERTAALEASNRELESFSYSVSHDLRAPLRGIAGFARALEERAGGALDDEARGYLARVRNAAKRMGQLIDDLLSLSRLSRAPVARARVDLSSLVGEVRASLEEREPRGVDWSIEPGVVAEADPGLVRIVLENLCSNAFKFTRQTPEPSIAFGQEGGDGEGRTYFVRDNGAGFDMAHAKRLFSPFQRMHSDKDYEGTGIGLATVHRIIERHGGRVWAEASPGKGATVRFTLGERGESA